MLKPATEDNIRAYLPQAYALALDPARSGYPSYLDGIKTRTDFEKTVWRGMQEPEETVLLFQCCGKTDGLIQFFAILEDRYLQTEIFNISGDTAQALAEFEEYCTAHFPGYSLYLGFPGENVQARHYLEAHGWTCMEHSRNYVAHLADYRLQAEPERIVPVTKENFGDFQKLHRFTEEEMYWTAQRILENLEHWHIGLAYRNGAPAGAIYYMDSGAFAEIYGMDFAENRPDPALSQALLIWVQNGCKRAGKQHIVFFVEEGEVISPRGFHCVGEYLLFTKEARRDAHCE